MRVLVCWSTLAVQKADLWRSDPSQTTADYHSDLYQRLEVVVSPRAHIGAFQGAPRSEAAAIQETPRDLGVENGHSAQARAAESLLKWPATDSKRSCTAANDQGAEMATAPWRQRPRTVLYP